MLERPATKALVQAHGRPLVTAAVRAAIDEARTLVLAGPSPMVDAAAIDDAVRAHLDRLCLPSLRAVINATGVVLHTNLGRAPLAAEARAAVDAVAAGYSTLEYDVGAGERGSRHAHVATLLADLIDAEAGIAVNNCAGAVLLMLAALCHDREVVVARGELVEIGGGFRVPDVMRASGAHLVEIGTTNKVHLRDYEGAITEGTGAILVVHRSNFAIVGFTAQPELEAIAGVAKRAGVPLLVDVGSGLIAEYEALGPAAAAMRSEPRPADVIAAGADLVAFSGDKLLGGPQAGLLAGRSDLVSQCSTHPLARALRADKLTLAGLEATLRMYRDGRAAEVPVVACLSATAEALRARAEALISAIRGLQADLHIEAATGTSVVGGGALPLVELPTTLVLVGPPGADARRLSAALRLREPPVITRFVADRVAIDVRAITDELVAPLAEAVANAV